MFLNLFGYIDLTIQKGLSDCFTGRRWGSLPMILLGNSCQGCYELKTNVFFVADSNDIKSLLLA